MERNDLYAVPVENEKDTYEELNTVTPSIPDYAELDKSRLQSTHGTDDGNYQKLLKRGLRSAAQTDENVEPYEDAL